MKLREAKTSISQCLLDILFRRGVPGEQIDRQARTVFRHRRWNSRRSRSVRCCTAEGAPPVIRGGTRILHSLSASRSRPTRRPNRSRYSHALLPVHRVLLPLNVEFFPSTERQPHPVS